MNCPNCQLEIPGQTEFCPRCGAYVAAAQGAVNRPSASPLAGWIGLLILSVVIALVTRRTRHPTALLITLGLHIVILILHLTPYVVIGAWRKAHIEEIGLFFGPAILRLRLGPWPLRINCIPLGGYVKFANAEEAPKPGWIAPAPSGSGRTFQDLHWWERIVLNSGPILLLLAVSAIILGPASAGRSFIATYSQMLEGVRLGKQSAMPLLSGFINLIETGSLLTALAILATKEAAFNCIPIPSLNGGAILKELIPATLRRRIPQNIYVLAQLLSFVLVFGLVIYWIFAFLIAAGFASPETRSPDSEPAAFHFPDLNNFSTCSLDGSDGCAPNARQHAAPAALANFTASRSSIPSASATASAPANASPAAVVSTTLTFNPLTVSIRPLWSWIIAPRAPSFSTTDCGPRDSRSVPICLASTRFFRRMRPMSRFGNSASASS